MGRISRLEVVAAIAAAVVLVVLVALEPDILGAPFQNGRTVAFTVGGTALAALALVAMVRMRVPPVVRLGVLGVPFLAVNWWLLSPFFVDQRVDDEFAVTIAEAQTAPPETVPQETVPPETAPPETAPPETVAPAPSGPVLLGAGEFVGLAGHWGSGDAAFFRQEDGSHVLRFERFEIQNGPDLHVYVLPGAGRRDAGGTYLGRLRGNVGDQTYELPADLVPTAGPWTVLVWCEAFAVEFVAADVVVS